MLPVIPNMTAGSTPQHKTSISSSGDSWKVAIIIKNWEGGGVYLAPSTSSAHLMESETEEGLKLLHQHLQLKHCTTMQMSSRMFSLGCWIKSCYDIPMTGYGPSCMTMQLLSRPQLSTQENVLIQIGALCKNCTWPIEHLSSVYLSFWPHASLWARPPIAHLFAQIVNLRFIFRGFNTR